jgi:hypothetical protein
MPPEIQPAELARLVYVTERTRVGDWSLRSALVRYAQPEPQRVSNLLEQVRRIETALHALAKPLQQDGPVLWALVEAEDPPSGPHARIVELLQVVQRVDELADELAAWAEDRSLPRPDAAVDDCVTEVAARLDELGVPREEVPTGPPRRGGERRR